MSCADEIAAKIRKGETDVPFGEYFAKAAENDDGRRYPVRVSYFGLPETEPDDWQERINPA